LFIAPTVPGDAGCSPPARFLLPGSTVAVLSLDAPVLHGAAMDVPAVSASTEATLATMKSFTIIPPELLVEGIIPHTEDRFHSEAEADPLRLTFSPKYHLRSLLALVAKRPLENTGADWCVGRNKPTRRNVVHAYAG
jgi:hypothetical protein